MNKRTVYGVGYLGTGRFLCRDSSGKLTTSYSVWANMLRRCYKSYDSDEHTYLYVDVEVSEDWHNYQNFAEWYSVNTEKFVKHNIPPKLDKDLLFENNKIYSSSNCCILPNIINSAIIKKRSTNGLSHGVYELHGKFYAGITMKNKIYRYKFNTHEEARLCYIDLKTKYVKQLAEEYRHVLSVKSFVKLMEWSPECQEY